MIYVAIYLYLSGVFIASFANYKEDVPMLEYLIATLGWPVVLPAVILYHIWESK